MITLSAKTREEKTEGILPGVLYGPEIKSQSIGMSPKDFEKVFEKAGESSLISLKVGEKEYPVLIHEIQHDPISGEIIHVDFYQPILTEEVEASVLLIFEGESLAVKDLGGTLVKEAQEIEVKALPQNLPHEIKVDISILKTFEDEILVKDLKLPQDVKVSKDPKDIIAKVVPPTRVEEELEKPIEEAEVGEDVEASEEESSDEAKEETKEGKPEETKE